MSIVIQGRQTFVAEPLTETLSAYGFEWLIVEVTESGRQWQFIRGG